jgi:hypothetical protein
MIRKNQNQSEHRPLYREVIREAWKAAWREKRLWFFAIFAALLQTGGVFDVFFASLGNLGAQAEAAVAAGFWREFFGLSHFGVVNFVGGWLGQVQAWQGILFGSLFVFTVAAISVIAQGALVAGLGARIRGRELTVRECFSAGLSCFGPIALLNVFTLGLIRLSRFLILIPLAAAMRSSSPSTGMVALLAGLLFFVVSLVFTVVHVFALNALVLQEASLREAIARGFQLLKRVWLTALETSALLFLIGIGLLVGGLLVTFIMSIPFLSLMFLALLVPAPMIAVVSQLLVWLLFVVIVVAIGSFAILFQYAVWQQLYLRAGEGGAMAKIHRWAKWLTGDYRATKI